MRSLFLLLFLFHVVFASGLDNLQNWLKENSKIDFTQKVFLKEMNQWQEYKGYICIEKNQFVVSYSSPYNQKIFFKDKNLYLYSPEENQLIITKEGENPFLSQVLKILAGEKISKIFKVKKEDKNKVELVPNDASITQLTVFYKGNTIEKIKAVDKEGNIFIIQINKVSSCQPSEFKLPSKAEVIDLRGRK